MVLGAGTGGADHDAVGIEMPLRRAVERYIEDPLAEELIRGHLKGGEIEVYLEGGQLAYRPAGDPVGSGRLLSANV